jgi:hypothetical protein
MEVGVALEGTLRDFSLSDIFQLIGLQRKTGVLTLRSKEDVVTVSFLDGKVVGADSLNKRLEDRLGQVLLKTGAVTKPELDAALKTQMETLERLGHILLERSVISREELKKAFEKQILQIIYRVFRWQDGDYHFSQESSVDYDAELVTAIGSESILMEGARMLDEWPIIEKAIPHREVVFVATQAARQAEVSTERESDDIEAFDIDLEPVLPTPSASGHVRISPVERDIVALIDGVATVDEIVRNSPYGEFDTCKALYTLLTRSLIRQATREEMTRAAQLAATAAAPQPSWRPRFPWLVFVLLSFLVATIFLAPHNPGDPLLGPGPKLVPRLRSAASWARMAGIWRVLQARAYLIGSYPETLAELSRERFLTPDELLDPWGWSYRYILREQSVLLAGNNASGAPDSNLIFFQHLKGESEEANPGPGAKLLTP